MFCKQDMNQKITYIKILQTKIYLQLIIKTDNSIKFYHKKKTCSKIGQFHKNDFKTIKIDNNQEIIRLMIHKEKQTIIIIISKKL